MRLATSVIRGLARPFLEPMDNAKPRRLRAESLELLYLYPADLLLRGQPRRVAHVRAAMTRTELERCAYLVQSREACDIQDELARLAARLAPEGEGPSPAAQETIRGLSRKLDRAEIDFEEWTALETLLRRLERRALGQKDLMEEASDAKAPTRDTTRTLSSGGRLVTAG